MPVRYRRRRVLIISVVSIFVIIYLFNNRSKELVHEENDLSNRVIKKNREPIVDEERKIDRKRVVDEEEIVDRVTKKISTTTSASSKRVLREELVEIDGKKLRKIDWHDYEAIDRENARIGRFSYLFTDVFPSFFFIRSRGRRCRC